MIVIFWLIIGLTNFQTPGTGVKTYNWTFKLFFLVYKTTPKTPGDLT